jgi:hypothetical protein
VVLITQQKITKKDLDTGLVVSRMAFGPMTFGEGTWMQGMDWDEDQDFGGRYEILEIVSRKKDFIKQLIRFVPPGLWGKLSKGFKANYPNGGNTIR